jgi:mRNA interferase MazF
VPIHFQGKNGWIVLDQVRALDKIRLIKKAGHLPPAAGKAVLQVLQEMFTE